VGAEHFSEFDDRVIRQVVTDIKYAGYEQREARMAEKLRGLERVKLSAQMDYNLVTGLRFESKEKLDRLRPLTLGQASRIAGVNPADIVVLMVHLGKKR
jgi:tRNA uridine 5-carboxymethylaminomethyl modification enzyme